MGETRTVKGCCPLDCQDTCSWIAEVEQGRVVAVRGAKDHPFTRGALCAKVNDYPARTYAPDRLLHPLRRVGPKGAGQFEPISWDAALDLIAQRFKAIAATHGPEALLPHRYLGSMGMVQCRSLMRLFHALGASRAGGGICAVSFVASAAEGLPLGFDPEDIADSRLILLWGVNILTTCHHHWHFIQEARRRHNARVICLDPVRTRTARQCDEHVALRPGTDAVLAAGMARVMLEEGLADLDHARAVCADLDALAQEVAPWTPARVAELCGIAPETVVRLAREFAAARPAVIRAGVGAQQSVHGEDFVRAVHALAVLGGHWRHRGGGVLAIARPDLNQLYPERADLIPAGRSPRVLDMARLGETLTDPALDPPIHGLMVWGTNPAVVQPDAGRVRQGLAREDLFTVVVEHFLTDTARFADVVLPSTTQLEHFDVLGAWGHHYISVNLPAVAPLGEARSHGEIMRGLAPRLGLDHPAMRESDEEIAASALPPGLDLATLKQAGWFKTARPPAKLVGAGLRLAPRDGVALPPSPPSPGMLRLMTPKAHFFLNSSFVNQPRQRRAEGRPTLDMTAADAAARGLRDGQVVRLRNAGGVIPATLRITDAVVAGAVSLPGKWWSMPEDQGAVSNLLCPGAWSPGGQPAFNEIFVEVVSAEAGRADTTAAPALASAEAP
ncbi:molybdopterin-dependent oxidoreductase [Vineibacter terrae]|uniref:molybdopterin-containing oxidoreductase family protein n=1 Tax=Vineibacter terrae TaxID=2586908 RepID=UPI002E33C48B|nr:molybdopterin-dependent oxidoreductase [Vineibacter terrae]HEX2891395.1 molybdopterin-dependent oxidoreductase [Vineibacter terrae]